MTKAFKIKNFFSRLHMRGIEIMQLLLLQKLKTKQRATEKLLNMLVPLYCSI